jgi:histidyl-tRNA synthetase
MLCNIKTILNSFKGIKFSLCGADRPQKDDLESFQCDADVVGSKSLWQEVELVNYTILFALDYEWRNGKKSIIEKILSGIAEVIGASSDKVILRLL